MIVARAPLRFSLGGGGSDLPAYAERHGGFVVSAAIDKYVYVTASPRFDRDIRVSYARTEIVSRPADLQHPIVREALASLGIQDSIEITSVADLPAHSGLGSSGTFTVALLRALHAFRRREVDAGALAREACAIEIDRLNEPVGRQDQHVAAFGGLVAMTFEPGGLVDVERLDVSPDVLAELERSLVVVHTGVLRPAGPVLAEQGTNLSTRTGATAAMHRIKAMGHETRVMLRAGDVERYGTMLQEHWELKRSTAGAISSPDLDAIYDHARAAGATGGKLMGAGGGGFFLFFVPTARRPDFERRMIEAGRRLLPFHFEATGATVLLDDRRP